MSDLPKPVNAEEAAKLGRGPKAPKATLMVIVYCGSCAAERRAELGRLGQVSLGGDGGAYGWESYDPHHGRKAAREAPEGYEQFVAMGWVNAQVLHHPEFPAGRLAIPDRLAASCPRHGRGTVDSTEVVAAATRAESTAQRVSLVLPLRS